MLHSHGNGAVAFTSKERLLNVQCLFFAGAFAEVGPAERRGRVTSERFAAVPACVRTKLTHPLTSLRASGIRSVRHDPDTASKPIKNERSLPPKPTGLPGTASPPPTADTTNPKNNKRSCAHAARKQSRTYPQVLLPVPPRLHHQLRLRVAAFILAHEPRPAPVDFSAVARRARRHDAPLHLRSRERAAA